MQSVILAGGLGTRLGEITKRIPKPMVPIAGTPYLEHQLRALKDQGFTDIVLLTGYLGEQIEEYFGSGERLGLSVRYSREVSPLGTAGALRRAADLLADQFLLIYGDSYLPIEYARVLEQLERSRAVGLVVAYDNRLGDTSVRNNLQIGDDGYVLRYSKDSPEEEGLHYVEAGVLAFRRTVLDLIPPDGQVSLENEVFPRLISRRDLIAWVTSQRFYDIGTPDRLKVINELFA